MEEQILFKINREEKEKIKTASKIVSLGISGFVRTLAIREADKIIKENKEEI